MPFEIRGDVSTAVCYASVMEPEAIEQVRRMCDSPMSEGSRIRIMPDAHAGTGCTIGTTMTIHDRVVPNIVGVDIGCGMYAVNVGRGDVDLAKLDAAAHEMPSGFDVWDEPLEGFDLSALRCHDRLMNMDRIACSLGSLGGGNHFVEVDVASDGTKWLVIHSGSRNLGAQMARLYQSDAVKQRRGDLPADRRARREVLIADLKAQDREGEIADALRRLRKEEAEAQKAAVPDELAWLEGQPMADYLHDMRIVQAFARRNRELMAEWLCDHAGLRAGRSWHTVHNYIDTDEMVLRKGAIAAHEGEVVLIPLNMRDGSVVAIGRGDEDWNQSAPHGAGRTMSRRAARATLSLEEYEAQMAGIYTTSVGMATIDEAPGAYKPKDAIMADIRASVDVIEVMRPIYNFKAS